MSDAFPELPGAAAVIGAALAEGVAPAAEAAVFRGGELVHLSRGGAAALAPQPRALGPQDLFDVASLTKVVCTATAAALLAGEGRLAVDEPVARRLPAFEAAGKERVTVGQLLAHSSGLPAWRPYYERVRRDPVAAPAFLPPAERPPDLAAAFRRGRALVEELVCAEPLEAAPGARAVYGDSGFLALGFLLERASGTALDALFAERIAGPLGLGDTLYVREGCARDARGGERTFAATERCEHRGEVNCGSVNDDNAYAAGGVAGHAGLFSSARDVAALGQAWLDALHGRRGLVDPSVAREFARRDPTPGSTRALGWDTPSPEGSTLGSRLGRGSRGAIGHLGYTGCSLWIDIDLELVCVLLTNHVHPAGRRPAQLLGLRQRFHDAVAEAVGA
ncbi:MAG TPA: serine hydrolase domain-containing protein [Anaeromyxobacteraceae bacterium]|nr:serine hydrolase domain-containing protein [Anaeromyxobacteraceae bacterium]